MSVNLGISSNAQNYDVHQIFRLLNVYHGAMGGEGQSKHENEIAGTKWKRIQERERNLLKTLHSKLL